MPNYDENERLVETGDVALTVEIRGANEVWRYTNSDAPLTDADGHSYGAVPLTISNVRADGALGGDQLDLRLPRAVPLSDRFFPVATRTVYKVVIRQGRHDAGVIQDAPLMFTGVVIAAAVSGEDGEVLRLKLSTQMGLLERTGLRRRYGHQCPYVLYGPECRASKVIASFEADIRAPATAAHDDVYVIVHGQDPENPWVWRGRDLREPISREFMIGSTIQFGGKEYEVISHRFVMADYTGGMYSGPNTIRLRVMPHQAEELRSAVLAADPNDRVCAVVPNCDHTVACCGDVFSNAPNFGGQPWIPYENPVHKIFVGM